MELLWDTPTLSGGPNNNFIEFENSDGNFVLNASNSSGKVEIENSDFVISGDGSRLLLGNGTGDLPSTCSIVDNYGRSGVPGQILTFNVENRTAWDFPKHLPQISVLDLSHNISNSTFTAYFDNNSVSEPTLLIQNRGVYIICVNIVGSCTAMLGATPLKTYLDCQIIFNDPNDPIKPSVNLSSTPSNNVNIYDGYNSFAMTVVTTIDITNSPTTTNANITDPHFNGIELSFRSISASSLTNISLTGTITIYNK
jgi:hypothetical protein